MAKAHSGADEAARGLGVMEHLFHVNTDDGPTTEALRLSGDKLNTFAILRMC